MDRLLYISTVGLSNIDQAQAARAHNLANVSTVGFRADLARVMATEVAGDGYRSRVYGVNESGGVDMSYGSQNDTGRDLDLAINGDGLLNDAETKNLSKMGRIAAAIAKSKLEGPPPLGPPRPDTSPDAGRRTRRSRVDRRIRNRSFSRRRVVSVISRRFCLSGILICRLALIVSGSP